MTLVMGAACCLPNVFADDKKESEKAEKFGATCPVSGKAAVKDQSAAYKEKHVYFCCGNCKAAFEGDNAKFATKANHQLVQTNQFKQTQCPLSGGKLNKEQTTKIDGAKVAFCCEKCKGAIESASKDDQLTKIFADEVFAKTFTAVKKEKKDKE